MFQVIIYFRVRRKIIAMFIILEIHLLKILLVSSLHSFFLSCVFHVEAKYSTNFVRVTNLNYKALKTAEYKSCEKSRHLLMTCRYVLQIKTNFKVYQDLVVIYAQYWRYTYGFESFLILKVTDNIKTKLTPFEWQVVSYPVLWKFL